MNKDKLRQLLDERSQVFKDVYGGEVTTYAPQPETDKRPWRKRKSLLDEAFDKAIADEEKRQASLVTTSQGQAQECDPDLSPSR